MKILIGFMFCIILSGCAANMAANGQNGPDLNQVKQQYSRAEVEQFLGLPISETTMANGHKVAIYDVEAKTDPSIVRAAGHGALDLISLGLWELVGGPIEMYNGRRQQVKASYDSKNRLVDLTKLNRTVL